MTYRESGPTLWFNDTDEEEVPEVVLTAAWGYIDRKPPNKAGMTTRLDPQTLYQVSILSSPESWSVVYFDAHTGELAWFGDTWGKGGALGFDSVYGAWEEHLDRLRDEPYTEPTDRTLAVSLGAWIGTPWTSTSRT